jgi:holo-[acyl-carrier protein] synthase
MMGIGVDFVDLPSFEKQLSDPASQFAMRCFTERERGYARRQPRPSLHLAARYAAKEAFIKAWSSQRFGKAPLLSSVDYQEIEVVKDRYGRPGLELHGRLKETVGSHVANISLSHDGPCAVAFVVLRPSSLQDNAEFP